MRKHAGLPDHALHGRGLAPPRVLISKIREECPGRMLTFSVMPEVLNGVRYRRRALQLHPVRPPDG